MLQSIHKFARMACVAAALLSAGAAQAELREESIETIVPRAARLFDGTSKRLREDAVVVVRGEPIIGVGSEATIPPEARTFDLGDAALPAVLSIYGCTRTCDYREFESFQ